MTQSSTDFTIADVLVWARTKPADERYRYSDFDNCACAQFCRHQGVSLHGPARWRLERDLGQLILDTPYYSGERKFSDLVVRLEKLCPDQVIPPSEWTRLDSYMTDIQLVNS